MGFAVLSYVADKASVFVTNKMDYAAEGALCVCKLLRVKGFEVNPVDTRCVLDYSDIAVVNEQLSDLSRS